MRFINFLSISKKLVLTICGLCCINIAIFCNDKLSENEQQLISQVCEFRLNLEQPSDPLVCVDKIDSYYKQLKTQDIYISVSDEIKLVIDNIMVWEKYNYLYKQDINDKQIKELILAQFKKNSTWFEEHPNETPNKWLYLTAADTISCSLQFLPLSQAMSDGLTVRKYYEAALLQDPEMSPTLMNLALWHFYAPAIAGGGNDKALKLFLKATESAHNDYEKFFSHIQLSQMYFELKDYDNCTKHLDIADKTFPVNQSVNFMRKINDNNLSYFYYTLNRMKIEKKGILK